MICRSGMREGEIFMFKKSVIVFALLLVAFNSHAADFLKESGLKGGLIVVLGTDNIDDVAGIASDKYVIQVLGKSQQDVLEAREQIKAKGVYGKVSVSECNSEKLPYVDNLVNLVVVQGSGFKVQGSEIERVLAPGGVSIINGKKSVKPVPAEIDEWRHYLHDADNNAVANDTVVGAPRHIQWRAGPDWVRDHHKLASVSALVTARGRIFSVIDTATTATYADVPARWRVVARDAFNGLKLWKQDISSWTSIGRNRSRGPVQVPRLLVTDGERVYVPLGNNEPISALDAVTGESITAFEGTENAEELLLVDSKLIVLRAKGDPAHTKNILPAKKSRGKGNKGEAKQAVKGGSVVVVDLKSNKTIFSHDVEGEKIPVPQTIASDGKRIYYETPAGITALDIGNGKELWNAAKDGNAKPADMAGMRSVLVVSDDVVLSDTGRLTAYSAVDGKVLWSRVGGKGAACSPPDIFVIDGLVWTRTDVSQGLDLKTGEVKKEIVSTDTVRTIGHHYRCYRGKATVNYLMDGYRGVEMYDLDGDDHSRNNWLRGVCQYGTMPANGLIYAPGHSCCCYWESMLFGFYALAPERKGESHTEARSSQRLR